MEGEKTGGRQGGIGKKREHGRRYKQGKKVKNEKKGEKEGRKMEGVENQSTENAEKKGIREKERGRGGGRGSK